MISRKHLVFFFQQLLSISSELYRKKWRWQNMVKCCTANISKKEIILKKEERKWRQEVEYLLFLSVSCFCLFPNSKICKGYKSPDPHQPQILIEYDGKSAQFVEFITRNHMFLAIYSFLGIRNVSIFSIKLYNNFITTWGYKFFKSSFWQVRKNGIIKKISNDH